MGNIFLGFPNRIDNGVVSGGSWSISADKLKTKEQWDVARTSDAQTSSTQFIVDLSGTKTIRAIALANHNLSQTATWRITGGSYSDGNDVFDTSYQSVWGMTFDTDIMTWEDSCVWEGIVDVDGTINYPYLCVYVLPDWKNVGFIKVEINDTTNPQGYVEIGRCFIGGGFTPKYNPEYGLKDSWQDRSGLVEMSSGATTVLIGRRYRKVEFSLPMLSQTEASVVYELQRRQGKFGEVLYIPDVSDMQAAQRFGMLGRMEELSAIEYPFYNNKSVGFSIKEI